MDHTVAVRMEGITKHFGRVFANQNVQLEILKGEIHSILGENGAGKSSLMNILSGIYLPDSGSVFIKGKQVNFHSPKDAIAHGIGMVHQHFKLVNALTVAENIIAGQKGDAILSQKSISGRIRELSEQYGLEVDPNRKVHELSVAEKQRVEILKVLFRGAEVLILDEPTAVLTPQEADKLFGIMRCMSEAGCSIILITHKLHEVLEVSHRVTIMRKGHYITTVDNKNLSPRELTDLMVGKACELSIKRVPGTCMKKLLEVNDLTVISAEKTKMLDGISFHLCGGEILGVAGVAGSGQKELCEAIAGLQRVTSGNIAFQNESITGMDPGDIIDRGISLSFVPEDRLGMGLVSTMDITNNLLLKEYRKQKKFFITRNNSRKLAEELIEKLNIETPGANHPVRLLSGGNIQKVLLGREIEASPQLIMTAYPTRGLDVASSHLVYDLLNEQKQKGVAVLYVGEDLDVLLELCDRILVLCAGKITGIVDADKTCREDLGFLMAGLHMEVKCS